jgi:hypothetical protein
MAAKVSQLPAQLDAECVAGDPFSIAVTSSGATITSPTVTLKNALGATITGTVPSVTQVGAVTTVAFSAATTAALNTDLTRPVSVLWSLSALVNGAGPFQLVARRLTIHPVGTAGVSSTSSATLAVTVGGAAVSLAVALGGVNGGVGAASDVTYSTRVTGDAFNRLEILADGTIKQGDGVTTPAIPYNPYVWELDGAIETMPRWAAIGQATVISGTMITSNFIASKSQTVSQVWSETATAQGTNQVQTLTMTGTPTGGTFTLTFAGQTTAAIPFNATATQVRDALLALSNVGNANQTPFVYAPNPQSQVTVAGGPFPGTPITVTFTYGLGATSHTVMTANSASLTGGTTPTVTPSITTAAAGATLIKWGLYEYNADYDATLVAETTNKTTLFTQANSMAGTDATFTSPFNIVRGRFYGLGLLVVSGATMPAILSHAVGGNTPKMNLNPPMNFRVNSLADLPASMLRVNQTANGVYASARYWAYMV